MSDPIWNVPARVLFVEGIKLDESLLSWWRDSNYYTELVIGVAPIFVSTLKINRYEGNWLEDQRHGQGTYTFASGGGYRGEWKQGQMDGMGCYTSATGARYDGMYR